MLLMLIQSLLISAIFVLLTSKQVSGSGVFQIQPLVFLNEAGVDEAGNCCTGNRNRSGRCTGPCRTYFRICLSHYQSTLPPEVTCTFGRSRTRTLGNNSIYFANNTTTIRIPFEFTWPGSFTLIVEAWHDTSASITNSISSRGSVDVLVYRIVILGTVDAGSGWRTYDNASTSASGAGLSPHSFRFRLRVVCNETYFGPGCSDTCQPRDDKFGHYTCSRTGTKICKNGWRGQYCDKTVCLDGCHVTQGYCDDPYECKCRLGWQGKLCRQCIPYPGCQHGYCKSPWQCNCEEGWGGLFCNQDLNFCTNYQPCRNGGTCTNAGQGSYSCTCSPGFTGTNCEKETEDCNHIPCQNGGKCQVSRRDQQLRCSCLPNYYGSYCQWNMRRSCYLRPCLNNGTCTEHSSSQQYHCLCPVDFTGLNCETRLDACHSSPCLNGGRCISTSGGSGFACLCGNGNGGRFCEDDRDHCAGSPCLNGAACLPDRTDGFRCRCPDGFAGVLCQDDVDDCLDGPCSNGATCVDLVADFRCACAVGFSGRRCTDPAPVMTSSSSCVTSSCRNAGTCVQYGTVAKCLCTLGFRGEFCEIDDVTIETAPDKQVVGDVSSSSSSSSVTLRQVVLIGVLGAGIPVIVLLTGVVFLVVRRRRALDDVTVDNSNVRNDDVMNCNRKKLADASSGVVSTSGGTAERPVKISNKERQQRMQCDRERQEDIYATIQQQRQKNVCDSKCHVTEASGDRTLWDPNTGSGNRTRFRLDPAAKEQPFSVEARTSLDAGKLQQSKPMHEYVLATEV